ncbi:hypothetical protein A7D25_09340 [Pseudomonas sp. 21C1]|nr:hypothetical protein A7D25_09340 [Pseudomonas sp. 21C1]
MLVTGASGFLGHGLIKHLSRNSSFNILALARTSNVNFPDNVTLSLVPGDDIFTGELPLRKGQVVVHLAARAHVTSETCSVPLDLFRSVNVDGALNVARQALSVGVKRFIFISSIGVNGSNTHGTAFTEQSPPLPHADYALSKLEAEQGLWDLFKGSDVELVVIRPPLVYAGHAPGNFARLLRLVASKAPLPFAAIENKRSMVALENLVDFISLCIDHPAAADELFLISDGADVSTADIIRHLRAGMNLKNYLFPFPELLMRYGASVFGKQTAYMQLCGSLCIDSSKARNLLGWFPKLTPEEALRKAGQNYQKSAALRP